MVGIYSTTKEQILRLIMAPKNLSQGYHCLPNIWSKEICQRRIAGKLQ